ncbi:MAG: NAD(P)-binding protein [Pseudomonadota bacterium]
MDKARPKKVAIFGGGCAGVSAAFELTRPERNGEFEVTLYQMGWRLGGKGASGRDAATGRIEEHGLHLWMGFYENAFRFMRDCYAELDRPAGHPLRTWDEAFVPDNYVGVTEKLGDSQWANWAAFFPPSAGLPGDPLSGQNPFSVSGYLAHCMRLLHTLMLSVQDRGHEPPNIKDTGVTQAASQLVTSLLSCATKDTLGTARRAVKYGQLAVGTLILEAINTLQTLLGALRPGQNAAATQSLLDPLAITIRRFLENMVITDPETRRIWEVIDVVLAIVRGVLREGVLFSPRGFDLLDKYDWREWLLSHGAAQATIDSAFIRGSYDLLFAFEEGDVNLPSLAAGQAIRGAMRMFFTYRGALFWKMQAGMGDVVFAPAYEVLKRRGVKFEFFHRLEKLGLSADKSHVETATVTVQAEVKEGADYDPLVPVKGLPCWPALPQYDQLKYGTQLGKKRWNPEEPDDDRSVSIKTLKVTEDFDFAMLAVGYGAVPGISEELIAAEPAWQRMVDSVQTVATQAFQVWLDENVDDLGWQHPPINISGYVEPFDTWADMRQLIEKEDWPTDPKAIAYFCSVLPDTQCGEGADAAVRDGAINFLNRDVAHFWPDAVTNEGFRWELLSGAEGTGEARFESQFWTANTSPTERYVLSLPGTLDQRISPLDNRFDNFTVAGDWTGCGHMAGCVEAAVMSGLLAASALSGTPHLSHIIGYDHP